MTPRELERVETKASVPTLLQHYRFPASLTLAQGVAVLRAMQDEIGGRRAIPE